MSVAAVCDAGPIIHLAEIESLSLLSVVDHLFVPETVVSELEDGGLPDGLTVLDYTTVCSDPDLIAADDLDPGEVAALGVAVDRDATLLTDDFVARQRVAERGVEVHGSLGVVALAYARNQIDRDDAVSSMRNLQRETSLFVTDAVVERGIDLLDEK